MLIHAADLPVDPGPKAEKGSASPRYESGSVSPRGTPRNEDWVGTPRDGWITDRNEPGGPATPRLEGPATPRLRPREDGSGALTPRDEALTPRDGSCTPRRSASQDSDDEGRDFPDDGRRWRWAQDLVEVNDNDEVSLVVPKSVKEAAAKAAEKRRRAAGFTPVWSKTQQAGKLYSPRTGHAVVMVGNTFYLMGGTSENGTSTTVYTFSLSARGTGEWAIMPVAGQPPCPRSGSKTTVMGESIVMFGGYSKRGGVYFNDLHVLDLQRSYWTKINVPDSPPARVDHTLTSFESDLFVFGGFKDKQRFKDLQRFSFKDNMWTEINLRHHAPPGRVGHTAVIFDGSMFMFGGWSGRDTLDDLYEFRCKDHIVREIRHRGRCPRKRYRHSAAVHDTSMFIFGGTSKTQERFDDLFDFNFEQETWTEVKSHGDRPSARTFHCSVVSDGYMYVFGGYDGERRNDLYTVSLPSAEPDENGQPQVATPRSIRFGAKLAEESIGGLSPSGTNGAKTSVPKLAMEKVHPESGSSIARLQQQALRIMDVDEVPGQVPPLRGLFGLPVAPLLDSTANLVELLSGLRDTVDDALKFARQKVSTHGPDPHGLTEDMIAGIYLYTCEVLCSAVNRCLRFGSSEASVVKSFFPFLRLLLTALERLPDYSGQVYCGTRKDLSEGYLMGSQLSIWSFQSAMTDADTLANEAFLGKSGPRSLLCFRVTGGKDISAYSPYVQEKEILIPAGCTFTVEDVVSNSGGEDCLKLFRMRQTRASDLLVARSNDGTGPDVYATENTKKPAKGCCSVQ